MSHDPITRTDAAAFGFKRFYTGKPCRWGHVAERYTSSGNCVECRCDPPANWSARQFKAWRDGELDRARRLRAFPGSTTPQ
jgi:hypothetical protein